VRYQKNKKINFARRAIGLLKAIALATSFLVPVFVMHSMEDDLVKRSWKTIDIENLLSIPEGPQVDIWKTYFVRLIPEKGSVKLLHELEKNSRTIAKDILLIAQRACEQNELSRKILSKELKVARQFFQRYIKAFIAAHNVPFILKGQNSTGSQSPLFHAILHEDDIEEIKKLLAHNYADPNSFKRENGNPAYDITCLSLALKCFYTVDLVQFLLEYGADPNKHSYGYGFPYKRTLPLIEIIHASCDLLTKERLIGILFRYGANPDEQIFSDKCYFSARDFIKERNETKCLTEPDCKEAAMFVRLLKKYDRGEYGASNNGV
jgi:hypothetical protein